MENKRRSEEFLTQHDQESRTMSLLWNQVRRLQELLEFSEDSKIFHDPKLTEQLWQYLRSSSSSCYFEFKSAKLRYWNAAKYLLKKMWDSWNRFRLSTCSTRFWWITQWFKKFGDIIGDSENRRNWKNWERRTVAINTYILLFDESKTNVWMVKNVLCLWLTMPWVLRLVLKVWQFRVISPRRCICKISLTKRNFRAGSWISLSKFAQRHVLKGKGQKFSHRWEDWRMFSAEDCWVLFKKRQLSFSTQACHGIPWDYVERSGETQEDLT